MIKLVYPINENCRLTLEVSDANYNEQSGVVFAINFHHIIKSSNNIHHLIEDDTFIDKAKDKIAKLLSEQCMRGNTQGGGVINRNTDGNKQTKYPKKPKNNQFVLFIQKNWISFF